MQTKNTWENFLPQMVQENGFSPVCIRMWILIRSLSANLLLQI